VEALAEVHRQDGYPSRWPDDPASWLDPPRLLRAWVGEVGGTVAGHVAVVAGVDDAQLIAAAGRPADDLVMVSRLFVRPAARGRQLGEALLATATRFGFDHGRTLALDVVADRPSAATTLYERLGWRLVGWRCAEWTTPSGNHPRLSLYLLDAPPPGT
jgi:GNAT superfamily N-acetyltransferase